MILRKPHLPSVSFFRSLRTTPHPLVRYQHNNVSQSPIEDKKEESSTHITPTPPKFSFTKFCYYTSTLQWKKLIEEQAPVSWRPYLYLMRLDKPIGIWLLMFPCLWSLALAQPFLHVTPYPMILFLLYNLYIFIGATVMRGAGCTINDMWDRKIDQQVERTKTRPLASGQVTMPQAYTFLGAQLLVGLWIALQFNTYSILLGLVSMVFVTLYPLMKRVTYWPQFVLGIAFNWGALIGYPFITGYELMDWSVVLPMYMGGILWTLIYDTIYAHQDKVDDQKIGVKSTALRFGEKTPYWLTAFAVAMTICFWITGLTNDYHLQEQWPYYGAVLGNFAFLLYQIWTVQLNQPNDCMKKFVANKYVGFVMWAGILAANYLLSQEQVQQRVAKYEAAYPKMEQRPYQDAFVNKCKQLFS